MNKIDSRGLKLEPIIEKSTGNIKKSVNAFFEKNKVEIIDIQWKVVINVGFVVFIFYKEP